MVDLSGKHILIAGQSEALKAVDRSFQRAGGRTLSIINVGSLDAHLKPGDALDAAVIGAEWEQQKPFMATSSQEWRDALQSNFEQVVLAAQAVAKHMIAAEQPGHIIILSSALGLKAYRDRSVMGTTLAALHAVARIAAVDLGAYGININVVATSPPNPVSVYTEGEPDVDATIPLGRLAEMQDIGEVCCFLASEAARYITGAIIPVDGGYSITKAGAGTVRKENF